MNESREISKIVHKIKRAKEKWYLYGFNIPNCLNLTTYLFYGLSNIDQGYKNQFFIDCEKSQCAFRNSPQHIIQQESFYIKPLILMEKTIKHGASKEECMKNNFHYLYDRNPKIISNLKNICKLIFPSAITKYHSLDKIDHDTTMDQFIINKIHKARPFNDVIFYSHKLISYPNIPLYSYSKRSEKSGKFFFHFLKMAIGFQYENYCLRINSFKKSYHFCNGNLTEDNISDAFSSFHPYLLIYQCQNIDEEAIEYDDKTYKGGHKPNPPSIDGDEDLIYDPKVFIQDMYETWIEKENGYTFDEYMLLCLEYPAAFVAGTDYSFEKFGYMITVFFTSDSTSKENCLYNSKDDELKTGGRHLFIYYQKFLAFLRYICLLINSFIQNDAEKFITAARKSFSLLPIANAQLSSAFIDFIKLITEKMLLKADRTDKTQIKKAIEKYLMCSINDGSELNSRISEVFDFSSSYAESSAITVCQAYKEAKECFKKLNDEIGDDYKSQVRKIDLKDHDKTKDYRFYQKLEESILATSCVNNDIV